MMKHALLSSYCLMVVGVVACGSNNNNTPQNASNCTAGQYWNQNTSRCEINPQYNAGFNQPLNSQQQLVQQQCATQGLQYNAATLQCVPQTSVTPSPGAVYPQPGQLANLPAPQPCQNQGQYWNGASCAAVVINQPELCNYGQVATQFYGCARPMSACETAYAYRNEGSWSCMPVPVSPCQEYKVKAKQVRKRRIIYVNASAGETCDSGCYSTGSGIVKIKYRKDGTIKKIKFKN